MTGCGLQLQTPMDVFTCNKDTNEAGAHVDGSPVNCEDRAEYKLHVEWADKDAADRTRLES